MLQEQPFVRLTRSLRTGFLSDRIIRVLEKALKKILLEPTDIEVLNSAIRYLEAAEKGFEWIDQRVVDDRSSENAFYFSRAVRALHAVVKTPTEFQNRLKEFRSTVQELIGKRQVPSDRIKDTKDYFCQISAAELENSLQLLKFGAERSRHLWI